MLETQFITYILRCADGTLYTGWTTNLERRLHAHNAGTAARYTRARGPVVLLASFYCASKREAMAKEYAIKQLSRLEKLQMIASVKAEKMPEASDNG